jgi:superfamily II DNA or RNA helicase/HKD family nuclease
MRPVVPVTKLIPGLYAQLLTVGLQRLISSLEAGRADVGSPEAADAHIAVAEHLRRLLERTLHAVPEDERLTRQGQICNALLDWLRDEHRLAPVEPDDSLVVPLTVLREVRTLTRGAALSGTTPQPLVPLSAADLLVNARGEPSVGAAIEREIHSADRIDLLCAFIRWNGLRTLRPALEAHCQAGRSLRVITTVYTGSTERRALDWLASIGAEVRVSYDTRTTRLHAKAWLFERLTGFSTAFIGSSNLTHSALLDGVEWNVRLAQASTPELIEKFRAAFESYWADPDYEPYEPARDADRFDRAVRATVVSEPSPIFHFDLQPWPFQREMLQRLEAERERHHRYRNLVVAATGTGKTLVAAFDYRRFRERLQSPSLLFVAHRREILTQSLNAYRAVLRDASFGELLVDGHRPGEGRHVFASVQSLAQIALADIAPDAFDVVVVDEFHHAAAPTYERLLRHLQPHTLLGLTATPERTDGRSVLEWFNGRIAVELRLWDALDRGLLSPFQYFGLHDGTDLSCVEWSRRGYDILALENVYTGDQARVSLIVQAIQDKIANPLAMRALGFCVSVAHARFMAREFTRRGLPSVAVSAETSGEEREGALRDLRDRRVNVAFCVDLFNEGVDVPEVDTVLFLRPTESALVFLQQLGRGLRRAEGKDCLTVLDFIGGANRQFRFDLRFRALLGGHRSDLIQQIEEGFPRLPAGCVIQLDRVASKIVLDNVKGSIGSTFAGLVAELRVMADGRRRAGDDPATISIADFLGDAALEPDDVYKSAGWTWSRLRRAAGLPTAAEGPDEAVVARALPRLLHLDDPNRLALYKRAVAGDLTAEDFEPDSFSGRALMGLHFVIWGPSSTLSTLRESVERLRQHRALAAELSELFDVLEERAEHVPEPLDRHMTWQHRIPLAVHSRASLDEILAAFGRMTFERRNRLRQGVDFDPASQSDLFFVTLEKAEGHYSPTTMYRDYAISPDLFHWESQSTTSVQSPTGQRYLSHRRQGTHVFLFVRHRKHEAGRTAAYTFLGAADYVSHEGSRPIAITWRLRKSMPDDFFREAKVAAG